MKIRQILWLHWLNCGSSRPTGVLVDLASWVVLAGQYRGPSTRVTVSVSVALSLHQDQDTGYAVSATSIFSSLVRFQCGTGRPATNYILLNVLITHTRRAPCAAPMRLLFTHTSFFLTLSHCGYNFLIFCNSQPKSDVDYSVHHIRKK